MHTSKRLAFTTIFTSCLLLPGSCGFGTAGIVGASSGGSSSSNAPASPSGLLVLDSKTSPATIRLVVVDAEADATAVEFSYVLPGESVERRLAQIGSNPATLESSPDGKAQELSWDWQKEAGLPADGRFLDGVTLIAQARGGTRQTTVTSVGNDAPVVEAIVVPAAEIGGIANVSFRAADSSGDAIDIEVEWFDEGDPAAGWRTARPAGTTGPLAGPAFTGIPAPPGGRALTFFWDTDSRDAGGAPVGDLVGLERNVRLRFRATDSVATQSSAPESAMFRVDNNDAPQIQVEEGTLLSGNDRVGGIPIRYRVFDPESDPVAVIFQWRTATQSDYPALGTTDRDELAQLLQDPLFVQAKQICRAQPTNVGGAVRPVATDGLLLSELRLGRYAETVRGGLVGRDIALMRPWAGAFDAAQATWASNPVQSAIAAFPHGGRRLIVVDDRGGQAALLEVDGVDGTLARTIATITGQPTAATVSTEDGLAFVAVDVAGAWQVHEVDLTTGLATLRIAQDTGGPAGPLRGVAIEGRKSLIATGADNLLRLSWSGAPTVATLVTDLAEPHGVVVDRTTRTTAYYAERTATVANGPGRVVRVDLRTYARGDVSGLPAGSRPTALALDEQRSLLLAVCQLPGDSTSTIVTVTLGNGGQGDATPLATSARALGVSASGATVATSNSGQLLVRGGEQQRRKVVSFDPTTTIATFDAPFDPPADRRMSWQLMADAFPIVTATPEGVRGRFVWDSRGTPSGEKVLLRGVAADTETGLGNAFSAGIEIPVQVGRTPQTTPTASGVGRVLAEDLDGDGDVELVAASGGSITIFSRTATGSYSSQQTLTGSIDAAVGDMNNDGRLDVVGIRNVGADCEQIAWLQNVNGTFPPSPVVVNTLVGGNCNGLQVADVDNDGRSDILLELGFLTLLLFQETTGSFPATPTQLNFPGMELEDAMLIDIDGNGLLDWAVCKSEPSFVSGFGNYAGYALQTSPRTFEFAPALQIGGINRPLTFAFADLDLDGVTDELYLQRSFTDLTRLFVDFGDANTVVELPAITGEANDLLIADVDGNGLPDVLCVGGSDAIVVVSQSAPRTLAGTQLKIGGGGATDGLSAGVVRDVDGDGAEDLVLAGSAGVVLATGDPGAVTSATSVGTSAVLDVPTDVAFGNLDDVEGLDLATTSISDLSYKLVGLSQVGDGAFADPVEIGFYVGGAPRRLFGIDALGDTRTDFFAADPFSGQPLSSALIVGSGSVFAGDFDGDGDVDLAFDDGVYFQDGGAFGTSTPLFSGAGVAAEDLDEDGDVDFVVAGNPSRIYRQTSPGVWTQDGAALPTAEDVGAIADFDGDGRFDVCLLGPTQVLFQQPNGAFDAPPLQLPGISDSTATTCDIDGDGRVDLVVSTASSISNPTGRVFRNLGARRFAARTLPTNASDLRAADIDGDGRDDLVGTRFDQLRIFYVDR